MTEDGMPNAVEIAAELTVAWLGNQNNRVAAEDVPVFLRTIHATVVGLSSGSAATADLAKDTEREAKIVPAVSVRKSLASKDHIVSMIDGKPYKMLRRHLATNGLTPEAYRTRYNLKPDYPMVAPSYSEARRAVAHKTGLGAKRHSMPGSSAEAPPKQTRQGRQKRGASE
jgi:predicted transcriptional regulator